MSNNKSISNTKSMPNNKSMTNNKTITNNKTMTDNKSISKSTYSSNTFIIIVGTLSLIYIIIYIYNNYKKLTAMPTGTAGQIGASCPDYWDSIGDGKCQNVNKIGTCSKVDGADVMDFSGDVFNNVNTGNYSKCKMAQACKISWENIDRLC